MRGLATADLKLVPDNTTLLRAIARLKEEVSVNVELASPDLFIPVSEGWVERSPWETTVRAQFATIEPEIYRYPALDAMAFRLAVERATGE